MIKKLGMFKHLIWSTLIASAPFSTSGANALYLAPQRHEITIVNQTDKIIRNLFVVSDESESGDWEQDLLGENLLEAGYRKSFAWKANADSCSYDLRVVFDDDSEVITRHWNVCDNRRYVLN